jgi:cytochrome c biogenesis protein
MSVSTTGVQLRSGHRVFREAVELLSSMRFSISLLTVICISSVIGTVVKQNEPSINYVNQFGPFWSEVFATVGLTQVYSAWWFLLILAFLVLSTSLCIARNTPKILGDLRNYKEHLREQSLTSFHHRGQSDLSDSPEATQARIVQLLSGSGWKAKLQVRRTDGVLRGTMIAARKGAANKLGYIAAHSAIVLICVGGLLDGDLIVRAQMWLQGKSVFVGGGALREADADKHRLSASTPTFRAHLQVAEGARNGTALITMQRGLLLQDLPFDVELKKFIVEYYETGMPRLFASEIVIHDRDTGESTPALVKVNEPAVHRGVTIYQSSFDDGGSRLKLHAVPMAAGVKPFDIEGKVGETAPFPVSSNDSAITLEFSGLRVINVENFAGATNNAANNAPTDVRKVDLVDTLQSHLGSGAKVKTVKELRNVGPSFSYKLRDASGQAREYNNYMLPVELDGQRVVLAGVRDTPADPFRYLRIPVDENDGIAGWVRLREALTNASMRDEAVRRYVAAASPADKPEMAEQIGLLATHVTAQFAGVEPAPPGEEPLSGLAAVAATLERSVPADQRERTSEVMLRILGGTLFELTNLAREHEKLPRLKDEAKTQQFMTQSLLSLSDSLAYPAPVLLQLTDFTHVQASVFQVARAPGKTLVYLGCVFLIIGVFAMLYIRERRLWVWIEPRGTGTHISTALSTTRRTLDADAEFERLKQALLGTAR